MSNSAIDSLRTASAAIAALESRLVEARTALATAEAAVDQAAPATLSPAAYTVGQVATLLGMSRSTVAALIRSGSLSSVKLGGNRRVLPSDLNRLLECARAAS